MKSCMKIIFAAGLLAGVLGIGYAVPEPVLAAQLKLLPGTTIAPAIKTKPPVAREGCNGTCHCTDTDCTQEWQDKKCSDTPLCTQSGAGTKICSCTKKTTVKQ